MIPDREELMRWTNTAFTSPDGEALRDDFKRCLGALLDTLRELERVREELERCRTPT